MLSAVFIIAAVIAESTITTIPLTLAVLTVYMILHKKTRYFYAAFAAGLVLDSLAVRVLGSTSAFFVIWLYLVILYDRKYEIRTGVFVFLSLFFGSIIFMYIFKYNYIFLNAFIGSVMGLALYLVMRRNYKSSDEFKTI